MKISHNRGVKNVLEVRALIFEQSILLEGGGEIVQVGEHTSWWLKDALQRVRWRKQQKGSLG